MLAGKTEHQVDDTAVALFEQNLEPWPVVTVIDGRPAHRPLRVSGTLTALLLSLVILAAFAWVLQLETRLPQVHQPGGDPGMLLPGLYAMDNPAIAASSDWYWQVFGQSRSLVNDGTGHVSLRFYGTELRLIGRVGPESGRLYVLVDGQLVGSLNRDAHGSYISLKATQAVDRPLLLVSGLSYQDHRLELIAGGTGSVAISAIQVIARSPFPWAFTLIEVSLAVALFLTLRRFGAAVSLARSTAPSSSSREPR
jgi:hypothetical protein